jgi:hypothetical protein
MKKGSIGTPHETCFVYTICIQHILYTFEIFHTHIEYLIYTIGIWLMLNAYRIIFVHSIRV